MNQKKTRAALLMLDEVDSEQEILSGIKKDFV